jgi:hypothetical protein
MSPLSVVAEAQDSPGRRAIQLMREAQAAGDEQVAALLQTLDLAVRQAREIVAGGDVYPAGVRDLTERLAEHVGYRAQAIAAIMRPPPLELRETITVVPQRAGGPKTPADVAFEADFPGEAVG